MGEHHGSCSKSRPTIYIFFLIYKYKLEAQKLRFISYSFSIGICPGSLDCKIFGQAWQKQHHSSVQLTSELLNLPVLTQYFTIFKPLNKWIEEFHVLQKHQGTNFEALKL